MSEETNITARRKARAMAMQALYQWAMSGDELLSIETQYIDHNDFTKVDAEFFHEILFQVPKLLSEVDGAFSKYLDRDIAELNPIELAVLRVASYELLKRLDVPYKVVINEALTLALRFGSTSGHKYVNGVLDKVARDLRSVEYKN